jgi:DNA modification methylase
LKRKDLVGIPWRVALALQADGWWLRSAVVWHKPNAYPESATDRPTNVHEFVFLLTRSESYYFDQEAVREPYVARAQQRLTPTAEQPLGPARTEAGVEQGTGVQGGTHRNRFAVQAETLDGSAGEAPRGADGRRRTWVAGRSGSLQHRNGERWPHPDGRNVRDVWEIVAEPYPGAHFAVFPLGLVRRCLLAGCPEGGTVLDPFAGTGTTGEAARRLSLHAVLIEASETYCAMAAERLGQLSLLGAGS